MEAWSVRSIDGIRCGGRRREMGCEIQRLDGAEWTGQDKKDEDGKEDIG